MRINKMGTEVPNEDADIGDVNKQNFNQGDMREEKAKKKKANRGCAL